MTAPRLGYVVRFVGSLDAAVDFYERVLGQRLTRRGGHWAQFDCGSITLGLYEHAAMVRVLGVADGELGVPPGAQEIAFEVDDVDAAHAACVAAGARSFKPPEDRLWGERTGYLLDPDGALVELYTRIQREPASATEAADEGADQGEQARRDEMATPSSVSHQHGDPSD